MKNERGPWNVERHATAESQVTKCISKIQYFSQSVCRREKRTECD